MSRRAAAGGRIDREQRLRFSFDGHDYWGHPGDTLASALLANGVGTVGRSFKYHRPRGIYTAGSEEPSALVQLRRGGCSEPNVRATRVELFDGLEAESQNRWPSLRFDVAAVNDFASPLFPAGFYYKTFKWPAAFWMGYERLIRQMAGLGRAPSEPDPDGYDRVHAHCDVLVVGGGPAGLAAARRSARTGARVILADEDCEFGGRLLAAGDEIDGKSALDWVTAVVAELDRAAEVSLMSRTTVVGYHDHNFLTMVERVGDHTAEPETGMPRRRLWKVRAKEVVLATGAIERPLVFQNNDRPGVMLASAAQGYANRYGVLAGETAVVVTNNDSAYQAALELAAAGARVAALVDLRETVAGAWGERLEAAGIEHLTGQAVVGIRGRRRVEGAEVMRLDAAGEGLQGRARVIGCDLVAVSGGWSPTVHLFSQSGGRLEVDAARGCLLPGAGVQACQVVGAAAGSFDLEGCLEAGQAAGLAATAAAGIKRKGRAPRAPKVAPAAEAALPRPLWLLPRKKTRGADKRFVDLQGDVTAADLRLAVREGYRSVEHVKRYTTTGMGTDQGKLGNANALAIVAAARGEAIAEVGNTTYRPPYTPVTFGAIAGRDRGELLDPVRRTPMQGWHEARGAVFEPVGQWLRPRYYPRPPEDMGAAVDREVRATRASLGVLDATTLGKIDIRGPDAAEFLNWVYTNGWSKLGVGRCRYGLMLHEDGMVFDDGVTARLAEDRFHMTTTSGNAAAVLGWMEDWLQTEWPELKVYCTSVTEQWAVVSVSGPNARRLMRDLGGDIDYDGEAFPFMSLRQGEVAGIPARVFRISFTGELSYEINVPAAYGLALWEAVMRAGQPYAATPFGTEAMHVLRAEVGFIIVGQETDGTVTPMDLGLEAMVSPAKDFLGKRSLARADTARPDRRQLIGLLTEDSSLVLPEGAQVVETAGAAPPVAMIGHVTSSYRSPSLERSIALALVDRGGERHGERVFAAWDGRYVPARITEPRFFDREGRRARG
ncbi:MAG: sarcosine oxidase subunit alpha family protein [Alphaproteobacteria bacterium]|jgi:sarcosine oxidase subunit alpha|nr:sarcosine oxidase subunit alpha family protein [Alphaproteobacteria bacterium]